MREYDLNADWYANHRSLTVGVFEVEYLIATLDHGASVLDVGCGNGVPLTRTLLASGCSVLGVDSSPRMLEYLQLNCPGTRAICSPIQTCDFSGARFDGVLAWDVLVHLTYEQQLMAIAKIVDVLKIGGRFHFTAGDQERRFDGMLLNGVRLPYWSFSVEQYREILRHNGMFCGNPTVVEGHNTRYYTAVKIPLQ